MNKLHIACGSKYQQEWVNVDIRQGFGDVCADVLTEKFWNALDDNIFDYIYHEHFQEHLTVEEGKYILQKCFNKLKKNGVLRIACPDLDHVIKQYYEGTWQNDEWLHMPDIPEGKLITTPAEYINVGMRNWGHKFLYDYETLKKYAFEAGFNSAKRCEWGKSQHQELCNLETRADSRLIIELTK